MIQIQSLIDDTKCFATVRALRWPDGVCCPTCDSPQVTKQGRDDTQPARQRYRCQSCGRRFDDLTGTIFAGHHQPLRVWILCLYLMGLNLSNHQIAQELDLNNSRVVFWCSGPRHQAATPFRCLANSMANTSAADSPRCKRSCA